MNRGSSISGLFDVAYVSPHPDDAVFSAGGSIALEVRAGRRVAVITVFSGGAEEGVRRAEDEDAAARLGATRLDLRLPEAPARAVTLGRPDRLFAPIDLAGPGVAPLVEAIASAIDAIGAAEIVGPLGVGRHADHQIAHTACVALAARGRRVALYEDLPYALCDFQTARRLAEIGRVIGVEAGGLAPPVEREGSGLAAWWALARAWLARPVLRELAPAPFLPLAAGMVASAVLRPAPPPRAPLPLFEERRPVAGAVEAKLAAIAAYATQWPRFHPTLDAWRAALLAHARRLGSPAAIERRFRIAGHAGSEAPRVTLAS